MTRRVTHLPRRAVALVLCTLLAAPGVALAAKRYRVSASGTVKFVKREAKTKIVEQRGTVKGQPFGTGTLTLRTKLAARKKLEYSIRFASKAGDVWGNGTAALEVSGSSATYKGTLKIQGGDGRYKGIGASTLTVSGSGPANVKTTNVRISGTVSY
ncbi:MAG: hypothetical protein PGN13_15625 [Patulibacter minatonensis]